MRQILFCAFILASFFCSPLLASTTKSIEFNGQNNEDLDLDFKTQVTRYREELVDSTCTREVIAGYEQVCRQVTQYRQECHYQAPRQECRTTPPHQECYNQPPRTQCYERPGQVICTYENGRRICRNMPGSQYCETIPGQRVCHTVPGQYYCETIPGQNICRQVPYYTTECTQEPRYRTESYACKKTVSVPYSVDIIHSANVQLRFENAMGVEKTHLTVKLEDDGKITLKSSEQDILVVAREENAETDYKDPSRIHTQASFVVSFLPKERVLSPIKAPADQVELTQDELSFVIGKSYNPSQLKISVRLFSKRSLFHKEININRSFTGSELQLFDQGQNHKVLIDLKQWGIDLPKRKYDLTITTEVLLPSGKIINSENLNLLQRRILENLKIK